MASKSGSDEYVLKLSGPGHNFDRKVTEGQASKIIAFIMGGETASSGTAGQGSGSTPGAGQSAGKPSGDLTPKQFMAQRKPANNYERVACLGYYLTHFREMPHFKTADINKLNIEAAHSFSNAALFVMHATSSYHYLSSAGGGKKQITTLGEAVVEALPDRAKVQVAIAEHKPTRRRSSRGRKRRVKS
jgi:hypothetical protein